MNINKQLLVAKISDIIANNNQKTHKNGNLEFLTYQLAKENNISDRHLVSAHKFIACADSLLTRIQSRQLGHHVIHIYNSDSISLSGQEITVIELANDDMPFIVDSITQLLSEKEIEIIDFFHPVVSIERDTEGQFIAFSELKKSKNGLLESLVQIHVTKISNHLVIDDLKQQIDSILQNVRIATNDWQIMLRKLDGIIADLSASPAPIEHAIRQESISFLRWLGMDHFTFLGLRSYRFEGDTVVTMPESGLGLFRNPDYVVLCHDGDMVDSFPELQKLAHLEMPIIVLKTNMQSTVHRRTHMDQIFIVFYENGKAVGLHCFIGLFTSTAYSGRASNIPLLERKVQTIMDKSNFRPQGHDGKLLMHILDSYPRDELFQSDAETLYNIVTGIISLDQRPAIRVFPRHDLFNRFVSCLVYLPRERLNTDNRLKIADILSESYGGRMSNFSIWFSEKSYVRIKYIIAVTPSTLLTPDIVELEAKIKKVTTDWRDSFAENLSNNTKTHLAVTPEMARKIASDFSIAYHLL
jgi:glutamate dehydrogenase